MIKFYYHPSPNPAKAQGTDTRELPVPSIFIIDRTGVSRFRHYDANYRVRLDAASVLAAAEQVRH